MARKKKVLKVSSTRSHPDPLATAAEKSTDDYGRKFGKLIEYEWFHINSGDVFNSYYGNRQKFDKLRKYARGEHSTDLHKKLLTDGTDGDSYTNYDWRAIQVLPKFIKIIVDQMLERLYEVDAQAIDGVSQGLRDNYKEYLEKFMVSRPMLEDAKNLLNIDLMPQNAKELPETPEEIALYMDLQYKPHIEIAIEEALKYTLELNDYSETQRRLLKDLTEIGIAAVHHKTDPVKGIVVDYRDPADMVWSYPTSSNFKNVYYFGHVERMTISDLQRISHETFDVDQLEKFKNVSNEWQTYNNISNEFWYRGEDLSSFMVDVLHFTFKTTNVTKHKKKYKKNGGFSITEKGGDFTKSDEQVAKEEAQGYKDFDVLEEYNEVWYEGSMVMGTEMIFNYGICEDMIRPDGLIKTNVRSNYIVYAPEVYQGRVQGLVDRVFPTIDQLQQIQIKIQQFIAKARPNGIYIDVEGLEELDLGGGNTFDVLESVRYYDETGNFLGTGKLADGLYNNAAMPIRELNNGNISGLEQLMNAYNFHLGLFRDFIGISQGADASLPDPRTSVGALQQTTQTSNVATRYILEGQLKITQYLCDGLALRLNSILKNPKFKKAYINSIGKINMDILKSIDKLHLHDFGITISLKPNAQDRQMLEANIQAEISTGGLSTTDGIDIRKISNVSLANEMLKVKKSRREKEEQKRKLETIKAQSDGNTQTAQATAQAKQEELMAVNQGKERLLLLQRESDLMVLDREVEAKMKLMDREYYYQTGIEASKEDNDKNKRKEAEDRKDKRTAIQATQQSKLVDQRNKKKDPIDFNSSHTSVTGELGLDDFRI
jgi:hypothetical protein